MVASGFWLSLTTATRADQTLYSYEGTVLPYDASAGWVIADPCTAPCSESVQSGRFRLSWPQADDLANYDLTIAEPPTPPPPTLWVEWRFRSNHPLGQFFDVCDGQFSVRYRSTAEFTNMYGDAAISESGDHVIENLPLNAFHTYRYESLDGASFRISVNGQILFTSGANAGNSGFSYLQLRGTGGCTGDQIPNMVNEWDFVRYGTIASGEQVVSTDPPGGVLGPGGYTPFTTFRVTFNAANYVYINDIAVEVTGGAAPVVTATRRTDTGDPETVEIVLDRALPQNQRTRFILADASSTQTIDYDFRPPPPPIPSVSALGAAIMALALLLSAAVILPKHRTLS